jgi:trehalose 6-phosphate synthase
VTGLLARVAPGHPHASQPEPAIVLVAHRGPLRFSQSDGRESVRRNAGGLVTALESLVQEVGGAVRWICAPASGTDRMIARTGSWTEFATDSATCGVRMLDIPRDAHHDFYNIIANPLLWFVQHELYNRTAPEFGERERSAWHDGYVAVNRAFASSLTDPEIVPLNSTVMVHDYHFYLVPGMLRPHRPDVLIHHFTHIPWPRPGAWRLLPSTVTNAIFRGLLGSDIIGFHTAGDVRNFLLGCRAFLGLPVDVERGSVRFDGRQITVRHYPISIDTEALETLASSPEVAARSRELAATRPEMLVLRVDRADPSKNIVRGFAAFARTLRTHPELHGRVTFLALLQPTRGDVSEYRRYRRQIEELVDEINAEFSGAAPGDWRPIDLRFSEDLALAIAAYKDFDVLLVNSLADGMNLVVKEALIANENDGVVLLSERAGAHDELGAVATSVDPFDVEQQSDAIYEALVMPDDERHDRLVAGAGIVRTNDMQKWIRRQLSDIDHARLAAQAGLAEAGLAHVRTSSATGRS